MIEGSHKVSITSFAVFISCAISITAFPVLARIINETSLLTTPVGYTALGAAAIDDVTAWSLLALSVALIHASEPLIAAWILLSVIAYALGVLVCVRPIWSRVVDQVSQNFHSHSHIPPVGGGVVVVVVRVAKLHHASMITDIIHRFTWITSHSPGIHFPPGLLLVMGH